MVDCINILLKKEGEIVISFIQHQTISVECWQSSDSCSYHFTKVIDEGCYGFKQIKSIEISSLFIAM